MLLIVPVEYTFYVIYTCHTYNERTFSREMDDGYISSGEWTLFDGRLEEPDIQLFLAGFPTRMGMELIPYTSSAQENVSWRITEKEK